MHHTIPSATSVLLVIVRATNHVHALLTTGSERSRYRRYPVVTSYQTVRSFLTEYHVPPDTPVARLDLLPADRHIDFIVQAPIPDASLPVGTVATPQDRIRTAYRGERWNELGSLSCVSIDVYLSLICQVGGMVCFARDLATDHP